MILQEFIEANTARFTQLRRELHQHPEIALEETRTSDMVARLLSSWGYDVSRGLAKTGVVGTLRVGNGKKVLGLRADMDALPMQEKSAKAWSSLTEGKFHGCGHDGHTTMLLFAAEWLAKSRQFNGTLHVIFQPGEEILYGGKIMLDDGLFQQFPCDAIFGLHNLPGLEAGHFYFRKGATMASSDTVEIDINGVGGHGAMPEKTVDAVVVACYVVTALQTIISRNVTPSQPAVVTVGSIHSGQAPNIINDSATLKLSVRTLDADVRQKVLQRITDIAQNQAKSFGATAQVRHLHGSPVLVNDDEMTEFAFRVAQETFDEKQVHANAPQLMASEDFAFMLEANPKGAYFFVGAGDGCPVHHPGYDFNDDIMAPAVRMWVALTERFLRA